MKKLVYGVGVNDLGYRTQVTEWVTENGGKRIRKLVFKCKYYEVWKEMLRCLHPTLLYDLYSYLGAVAIVREKDVDTLVQRMGQCFLSVVEEYTDKEWADNLSVHMKISSTKHQKLLTFSRSMVYNKFMLKFEYNT